MTYIYRPEIIRKKNQKKSFYFITFFFLWTHEKRSVRHTCNISLNSRGYFFLLSNQKKTPIHSFINSSFFFFPNPTHMQEYNWRCESRIWSIINLRWLSLFLLDYFVIKTEYLGFEILVYQCKKSWLLIIIGFCSCL